MDAVEDDSYIPAMRETLKKYNLEVFAISNHLEGQAVCPAPTAGTSASEQNPLTGGP